MQTDSGSNSRLLPLFSRYIRILFAWVLLLLVTSELHPVNDRFFYDAMEMLGFNDHTAFVAHSTTPLPLIQNCPTDTATDNGSTPVAIEKQDIRLDFKGDKISLETQAVFARCSKEFATLRQVIQATVDAQNNIGYLGTSGLMPRVAFGRATMTASLPEMGIGDDAEFVTVISRGELSTDEVLKANEGSSRVLLVIGKGMWFAKETHVSITKDAQTTLWSMNEMPTTQTASGLTFSGLADNWGKLELLVSLPTQGQAPAADNREPDNQASANNPLPELVRAAFGQIEWLQNLWRGLSYGLPLLLALLWARRVGMSADATVPENLTHFATLGLLLVSGLTLMVLGENIITGMEGWSVIHARVSLIQVGVWYGVFLALLWPLMMKMDLRGGMARPPLFIVVMLGMFAVLFFVAAEWWIRTKLGVNAYKLTGLNIRNWQYSDFEGLPALILLFAAAFMAILWLAVEMVGTASAFRAVRVMLVGWLLISGVSFLLDRGHLYAWLALLVIPFAWGYAKVSLLWIRSVWTGAEAWPAWLIQCLGVTLAVVLIMPPPNLTNPPPLWLLTSAVWTLLGLWQFLVLASVLAWLKGQAAEADARQFAGHIYGAATVFMVIMFYWPARQSWVPLLTTFGVGLAMLKYWLFASRPLRIPTDKTTPLLSRAITEIGFLNDLLSLRIKLRKNLLEKTSKGESSVQDFLAKREELEQVIKIHEVAGIRARGNAALALNRGSAENAWVRGRQGAIMATIISIPWIISYFWGLSGDIASMNAYVLSQLTSVLLGVGRWPALGFFFLFFYPHIRGYNGIQKGLVLTLALIAPLMAGTILWNVHSTDAWLSLLFWSLQAFVCCMTLGVVLGDIGALRRAGKGTMHLVEIYNVSTLVAWSSSVVIAVGAAVTTVLATQVGSLFTTGLKLLLPDMPIPGK
ncbi:MAG: hypothetical protein PHE17_06065 [Thiothrix sp.]|uniref:hypothetical protein n=1 Tax=Thiothrix sp. TaxID=1032 RepID=UPI0026206E09|nr:hypothetical protein [Thiothrix sp.]MDD5392566.1 hypothetical protein [Thiothrix sp.]